MGWGTTTHPAGTKTLDAFAAELGTDVDILDAAVVDGAIYAAVRHPEHTNGKVACEVSLYDRTSRNGHLSIAFKHMGETMGPNATSAPGRIMALLDPVDDLYPSDSERRTASAWRDRVAATHARKAAVAAALPAVGATATIRNDLDLTSDIAGESGTVTTRTRTHVTLRIHGDLYRMPHAYLALDLKD